MPIVLLVKRLFLKSDLIVWDIKICAVLGKMWNMTMPCTGLVLDWIAEWPMIHVCVRLDSL